MVDSYFFALSISEPYNDLWQIFLLVLQEAGVVMRLSLLVFSLLSSLVVEVQSEMTVPYVSFRGQVLPNNSYVDLGLVGASDVDSVQCHTDLISCCDDSQSLHRGEWYFPNRTRLPTSGDIHLSRGEQRVDIHHEGSATVPSGLYRCDIPTDTSLRQTVYVGLYNSGGMPR